MGNYYSTPKNESREDSTFLETKLHDIDTKTREALANISKVMPQIHDNDTTDIEKTLDNITEINDEKISVREKDSVKLTNTFNSKFKK